MTETQTQNPRAPQYATIDLVVAQYVAVVRTNQAAQAVIDAIADPMEQSEIIYELLDTARSLGFYPGNNPDEWWTTCRAALPRVEAALLVQP